MAVTRTGFLVFSGFFAAIALAMYPIAYYPLAHIDDYKKEQAINRAGVVQEDVQPAGLKVWSDPFSRK